MVRALFIAALLASISSAALADAAAGFNFVRQRGCANRPGTGAPLHRNRKLDTVAKLLSRGMPLRRAEMQAGYRDSAAATFVIPGEPDAARVEQVLAQQFCAQVADPRYTQLGVHQDRSGVWAVIAQPMSAPPPRDADIVGRRILELTNAARSRPRRCGSESFAAAPPVTLSAKLARAALEHSRDMAAHNIFDHIGSRGDSPGERMTQAGYRWRLAGENIASGMTSADAVMNGWLGSPHHCQNIMTPGFTEMGVAYDYDPGSADGIYWTQVFGTPAR